MNYLRFILQKSYILKYKRCIFEKNIAKTYSIFHK